MNTQIQRGILAVRASAGVPEAVSALGEAFQSFKASHKAEVEDLRKSVDDANSKLAALQIGDAGSGATPRPGIVEPVASRAVGMGSYSDFRAHYLKGTDPRQPEIGMGDFLRGVAGQKTTDAVRAALEVGTDSAGGYAVPERLMPEILAAMTPASSLLQAGARVMTDGFGAKSYTVPAVETIPTAEWRLERGDIEESDPAFRAVKAEPKSLAFYFKVSRELIADADNTPLDRALLQAIGQAFAKALDHAGLFGSGTDPEPRGIINTTGVHQIGSGTNGAAITSYGKLLEAYQTLLDNDAPAPTAAIMAPRSLVKFAGLADTTNQPLQRPQLLNDLRMISTSQVPIDVEVGGSSDCSHIFMGDFRNMGFFMRERVSVMRSAELFAKTGEIGFFCHVRADVFCLYPKALAVINGVR